MDLVLRHISSALYGVFGQLLKTDGSLVAVTLEHAFKVDHGFESKIPDGEYTCVRGMHRLEHMKDPFETFMVTGVPDHFNLLFHVGNYNSDSEGCILLGARIGAGCILDSRFAFERFMDLQKGCNAFKLRIC